MVNFMEEYTPPTRSKLTLRRLASALLRGAVSIGGGMASITEGQRSIGHGMYQMGRGMSIATAPPDIEPPIESPPQDPTLYDS